MTASMWRCVAALTVGVSLAGSAAAQMRPPTELRIPQGPPTTALSGPALEAAAAEARIRRLEAETAALRSELTDLRTLVEGQGRSIVILAQHAGLMPGPNGMAVPSAPLQLPTPPLPH